MTAGEAVVLAARRRLGVSEQPDGSNTGPWIDTIQAHATDDLGYRYAGTPWCAMAVREWFREAGLEHGWINPYTGDICAHADAHGWWLPEGRTAPPGALVIKCGVHVEIVEQDHGTWLADIGGNVSNAVRRTSRSRADGWRVIAPPFIGRAQPASPATVAVFGFDDPRFAPRLYGPWATREQREHVVASLSADKRRRVRRVRLGARKYAFELYPARGGEWHFGPWREKAVRDQVMHARERKTGRGMRPWAETRIAGGATPPPSTTGSVS